MWDEMYAPVKPNMAVKEHITFADERVDADFISAEILI